MSFSLLGVLLEVSWNSSPQHGELLFYRTSMVLRCQGIQRRFLDEHFKNNAVFFNNKIFFFKLGSLGWME